MKDAPVNTENLLSAFSYPATPDYAPLFEVTQQRELLTEDGSLGAVLDAMPQFAMILNNNRQILLGNQALSDFAGAGGRPEYVGLRPGELLSCQHAATAASGCGTGEECRTCGALETILAAQSGIMSSQECRVMRTGSCGAEILELRVWGTPFCWKKERFALVAAVDISQEKRRKMLERTFFHDILNTVSSLSSMTELMARGFLSIDDVKDDLLETVQTLIGEIRGQRDLLAAENNELKVVPAVLHTRLFLEQVARTYRNAPAAAVNTLAIDPGCAEVFFTCDERLLTRVVGNLLKNALEASLPGQVVTMGCRACNGEVALQVHNDGVIPDELQPLIFHRSFSTKGTSRGIGTYSVKLLTERYLKGTVSFLSTSGTGTTFTVTLPQNPGGSA